MDNTFRLVHYSIFRVIMISRRTATGIKAPVLYPNDSLIKQLNLSPDQVDQYIRTQRVHQNNMEFLTVYFPMLLIAGFENPIHTAIAGAVVFLGRLVTAFGYWRSASARSFGGW